MGDFSLLVMSHLIKVFVLLVVLPELFWLSLVTVTSITGKVVECFQGAVNRCTFSSELAWT